MPNGIVRVEADKPAEQQVVVELLNQQPLRANAIDRLQQQGQQQLLRRDRGPATLRVKPTEVGVETVQSLVSQPPHLPQGMGGWYSIFCGDVGEQGPGSFLLAAHPFSAVTTFSRSWLTFSAAS